MPHLLIGLICQYQFDIKWEKIFIVVIEGPLRIEGVRD
jgi:hypothetical protein